MAKTYKQPLALLPKRNVGHEKRLAWVAYRAEILHTKSVEADNVL